MGNFAPRCVARNAMPTLAMSLMTVPHTQDSATALTPLRSTLRMKAKRSFSSLTALVVLLILGPSAGAQAPTAAKPRGTENADPHGPKTTAIDMADPHGTEATSTGPAAQPDRKATAEDAGTELEVQASEESTPRALSTVAAVIPGLVIHGFGHYVAGDKDTAWRLFAWQGVGLGIMIASGATIGLTGASRYGNELTIPALVTGTGIFLNTAYADIYGSATGGRASTYAPRPTLSATVGYGYVDDPQFDYTHFSVVSGLYVRDALRVAPSLWTALDADNQRARLPIRYRQIDNKAGDFLQGQVAATYHRYGDDGFACTIGELSVGGRLNSSHLGASLAGSYTTATVGYALHRTSYDVAPADTIGLLLVRFGYGLYLPKNGEIEGYYQHRRDGFAAGLSPSPGNGSGFLGHFGLALRQPVSDRFAISLRSEIGSAWVATGGIEIRTGSAQ